MQFRLHRLIILCLSVVAAPSVVAEDSFTVVASDPAGQRLLTVKATVDGGQAKLQDLVSVPMPFRPLGIVAANGGKQLIVTSNQATDNGFPAATIAVAKDRLQPAFVTNVNYPAGYTSIDRTGAFLLSSNYFSGDLAVYRLSKDGMVGENVCHQKTPRKYAHCILTSRDNRFAYVPCVKENNALFQYSFDEKTGNLESMEPFDARPPAMHGPRHVAYHPTLPIAYFSNEQQLGVSVYSTAATGQLTDIQHAVTMPRRSPYIKGDRGRHASDLVVTRDGKWLFVAVRDFVGDDDSVFTFRVEADGRLSQVARSKCGDIPWKLNLSPDESFLLVSESEQKTLAMFRIANDGALTKPQRIGWNASVRNMVVLEP